MVKLDQIPRSLPIVSGAIAIGCAVGLAALYWTGGGQSNAIAVPCAGSRAVAARIAPLALGEVAAVTVSSRPTAAPALTFEGPDGKAKVLADFRGKAILLNLWATWCVPCRREMPSLDQLEAQKGGPDFEVVAINVDTTKLQNRRSFLTAAGVNKIRFYADPSGSVFQALRSAGATIGLPTTLLIDKDGCSVGSIAGPANWASPDGLHLVDALIGTKH
jgi:thiol-disulfide isomerase/thioredoxin